MSSVAGYNAASRPDDVLAGRPDIHPFNHLLYLPHVDGTPATGLGVSYETALVACQIIAGNAFQGRLTSDADSQHAVHVPDDGVLKDEKYFFFVDAGVTTYAVVPGFLDWEFPHATLPDSWRSASLTMSEPGTRCAVSNYRRPTDVAHIVPRHEEDWFQKNGMDRYCTEGSLSHTIGSLSNLVRLRSDLHSLFDQHHYAFVPKKRPDAEGRSFVFHVCHKDATEYGSDMQNTLVQYLPSDCRPLLFARFAWTVLLLVNPFVANGVERVVRVRAADGSDAKYETIPLSAPKLRKKYGGGGSLAATSLKRKRGEPSGDYDMFANSVHSGASEDNYSSEDSGDDDCDERLRPGTGE
ncbi:hypothetical protein SPI_01378 [Niveomyces insectorum RCEF 264]|uniref:HNH nuclease domain-containing protein n=1 Tax=Niveomyces insectorum RCEF 264 TaxID=1081102 RepID=A0A162JC63_9HYPO|nr:hypothetical protein SPI_01378 [Niveomyces insectorum RCEF 264]